MFIKGTGNVLEYKNSSPHSTWLEIASLCKKHLWQGTLNFYNMLFVLWAGILKIILKAGNSI